MRSNSRLLVALMAGLIPALLTGCEGGLQGSGLDLNLASDTPQEQPAEKPASPQAEALIKLAADVETQGNKKDTALSLYERAAEVSGQSPAVMVKLGDAYMRAGQKAQALKTYRAILAQSSISNEVMLSVGTSLVKAGDTAQGIPALQKAAAALKTSAAYDYLGIAHTLSGQFKEAQAALEAAHELAAEDLDVSTNLALVLALQGESEKAVVLMREVVEDSKAKPRHWRNLILVLAIAGQPEQARTAAGSRVPENETQGLMKRAETIRALNDPKARVKALGMAKS